MHVSVRPRARLAAAVAVLALPLALVPGAASGAPGSSRPAPPPGLVYTTTNAADGNAVVAYRRVGEHLQLVGTYPTGGDGTGPRKKALLGPPDIDQSIVVDRQRRLLFTVNEGSDSISVFTIAPSGALTPVKGSPFPSGDNPASLGLVGNQLYVVNKADDPGLFGGLFGDDLSERRPNYKGFRVAGNGRLTPIPHSTVFAPAGSSPTQALISPDGRTLFTSEFFGAPGLGDGSLLRSLRIEPNGRLVPVSTLRSADVALPPHSDDPDNLPGFLSKRLGNVVVGLQVHPHAPYVYVGQPLNSLVGGQEQLGVYSYDAKGALTYLRSVPAGGIALCWFVIDSKARRMYGTNTLDGTVSVFDISGGRADSPVQLGAPLLLSGHTGAPFGGPAPGQLALAPDGKHLYVTAGGVSTGDPDDWRIYVLRVNADGSLTEVSSLTTPYEPLGMLAL